MKQTACYGKILLLVLPTLFVGLGCSGGTAAIQEKLSSDITVGVMFPEVIGAKRSKLELTDMVSIRSLTDERRRLKPPAVFYERLVPGLMLSLQRALPHANVIPITEIPVSGDRPDYGRMGADLYAELIIQGAYDRPVNPAIPTYQLIITIFVAFFEVDDEGKVRGVGSRLGHRLATAQSPVIGPYRDNIPDIDNLRKDLPPEMLLENLAAGVDAGVRSLMNQLQAAR